MGIFDIYPYYFVLFDSHERQWENHNRLMVVRTKWYSCWWKMQQSWQKQLHHNILPHQLRLLCGGSVPNKTRKARCNGLPVYDEGLQQVWKSCVHGIYVHSICIWAKNVYRLDVHCDVLRCLLVDQVGQNISWFVQSKGH